MFEKESQEEIRLIKFFLEWCAEEDVYLERSIADGRRSRVIRPRVHADDLLSRYIKYLQD
jgi:hypothetical protein